VTGDWTVRFPDLTGKVAVVAGDDEVIVTAVRGLAGNAALLAIVTPTRALLDAAVAVAEDLDAVVFGIAGDPGNPTLWARIAPHVEQRLGPIDIALAAGPAPMRRTVLAALSPDMAARARGVLIEIDAVVGAMSPPPGLRHRGIQAAPPVSDAGIGADVSALVPLCASDTVTVPSLLLTLGN
jgi:hypothetical protein